MALVSIIMALSESDNASDLSACLDSIANQTVTNHETIIVSDGPVSDALQDVVKRYQSQNFLNLHFQKTKEKSGPAHAWNMGFDIAKGEYVARMDPDDIMRPERLEAQIRFMEAHPDIHVLGAWIQEFDREIGDSKRLRKTPAEHEKIKQVSRFSNPMNHVTILMRQKIVKSFKYEQYWGFVDYFFWLKLLKAGVSFHNLDNVLVDVRVGNGFLNRRHGWRYLQRELAFLHACWQRHLLGRLDILKYAILKLPPRLFPRWILGFIYKMIRR